MKNDHLALAKRSYLTSLRDKLKRQYLRERSSKTRADRRWINGFMAAGNHGGLITLSELKRECLSAYRKIYEVRMSEDEETLLERRLAKLCDELRG